MTTLGLAVCLSAGGTLAAAGPRNDVAQAYAERCAACHGQALQGGQAKSLLDDVWRFGGDDPSLTTSILKGHPDAGMPAFGAMLSEQEIRALVIFIREQADAARRAKTVFAKPQGDTVVTSELHAFRVETVAAGLETPWSICPTPAPPGRR